MSQAGIASGGSGGGGGKNIQTITGNTGGAVGPDGSNNINFPGATLYTVSGNPGTNTLTINPRPNAFPITPYVVGPVGAAGYQTIQSGLNAANAAGGGSVFVQPGTYVENLVLFPSTQVIGVSGVSDFGAVNINGVHTPPATGFFVFSGVNLISATDIFNSAVAGSATLVINNSSVTITNGFTFNLPNWTGSFVSYDVADSSTNNGMVNNTAGATCFFISATHGAGTGKTMVTSGPVNMQEIDLNCPWNATTGTTIACDYIIFTQSITCSNNSTGAFNFCRFSSGSNPALTMSSSGAVKLTQCTIDSTNNPAINGAGVGILTYEDIVFLNNASFAGTLTTSTVSWQPYARAIAASDGTKVGTAAFNSAQFTVDTNGFVSTSGTGIGQTITGDSGGALSPIAGNWNIKGGPGVTTTGSGNTLTINSVVFTDQGLSGSVLQDSGSYATAPITLTTPAAPGQGHELIFVCTNASTLVIKAAGTQLIRVGSLISSVGGTVTSSAIGNSITLRFRTADNTWYSVSTQGVWTTA